MSLFGGGGGGFGSLNPASSSAFGTPGAGAFGSPSPFGAQPAAATSFGSPFGQSSASVFGAPAAAAPAGGLFGSPQPTQPTGGLFGAPQAQSQQQAGGLFGAPAAQPSVFGQSAATPSPFGATAQQPQQQQAAFGALGAPAPNNAQFGCATDGRGTRLAPFRPEAAKTAGNATTAESTQQFRSICAMPQYAAKSHEELRFEDYQAGCKGKPGAQLYPSIHPSKVPAAPGTAFGGGLGGATGFSGGFGATQQGAFGTTTTAFGQPQAQTQGGLFGQPAASSSSLFGASASTFGQAQPSAFGGGTGFGQQPSTFGAPAAGGLFGQPQQQQQQQQQQQTSSLFGQPAGGAGGGLFGQPAASSATFSFAGASAPAFGAQPATPGLFGSTATQSNTLFGGAQSAASPFGASSAPAFGGLGQQQKPATGGLFGSTLNTGGSLFGGQPAGGGLFGQSTAAASPFGQAQQQQPAQAQGGLFGAPQSGSSLFGGGQPAGGGLFGQQQNTGSSLFAQPASSAGGGLFGNTGGGLFGSGTGLTAPSSTPSLFGTGTPALGGGGGGLFGATTQTATPLFGGLGNAAAAPAVAAATAMPTPVSPGQVAPYGALPTIPQLKSPAGNANGAAAAARPLDSVDVLFRPSTSARASALSRSHRRSGAPPSLDAADAARRPPPTRRSPSIFRTAHRDSSLVINTPLPSTNGATSPPAASPGGSAAATGASLPPHASEGGLSPAAKGTPDASPAADRRTSQPLPAGPASSAGGPEIRPVLSAERSPVRSPPAPQRPSTSAAESGPPLPAVPDGLYIRPSAPELRALSTVREDALRAVHGFTVGKAGVGEVLFLKSVDLSGGPDLGDICSFEPGVVSLYDGDAAPAKPPVGEGLNCPARVTLHLDRANLDRILKRRGDMAPEQQVAKLQQRLQRVCVETGARFVDARMEGEHAAEWVFEVQHWSRYGLTSAAWSDDSDEDLTESLAAAADAPTGERARVSDGTEEAAAPSAEDETSAEHGAGDAAGSGSPTGSFSLARAGAGDAAERHDSMMHDDDIIELDPALRAASHLAPFAEPPPMACYERYPDSAARAAAPPPQQRGAFPATSTDPSFMLTALPARVPDAFVAPSAATNGLQAAWAPPRVALRAPLPRPIPPAPVALPDALHPAIAALACPTAGTLHGAMSRARRVACGAGGLVATPARSVDASALRISRIQPGTGAGAVGQARQRAVRLLEVHAQYSKRAASVEDDMLAADGPDRVFGCTADMEPCAEFAAACSDADAGRSGADAAAAATFDLVRRLFGHIAPLNGPAGADAVVMAAQRKREVSLWLEEQAEGEVHTALQMVASRQGSRTQSVHAALLELISAHDLQGAATLATASGHSQLASLIATAGLHPRAAALLAEQIGGERNAARRASWLSSGMLDGGHVPPALAAVYKLLAGDVGAALPHLRATEITWPRALGLCLWYYARPARPVGAALDAYDALVDTGSEAAPAPRPPHARSHAGAGAPVDARYALLQLQALQNGAGAETNARATELMHRIARTDSYTADVLDAVLPWLLLCLLRAVPDGRVAGALSDEVFAAATIACSDTLRGLGEPLWALHALMHLPARYAAGKEAAIRAVLEADFGAICACSDGLADAQRFLCHDLRVPRAWLAAAEAVYARQRGEHERLVRALLAAGARAAAEAAFVADVVPPCVAARQDERLHEVLDAFEGRAERADFKTVQGFLRLRRTILGRGAPDLDEGVASATERASAIDALAGAAQQLSQLRASLAAGGRPPAGDAAHVRPRLERLHALFTGMCEQLLRWLQAGPADGVSAFGEPQLESAVASLPAEMLASHALLQHCC